MTNCFPPTHLPDHDYVERPMPEVERLIHGGTACALPGCGFPRKHAVHQNPLVQQLKIQVREQDEEIGRLHDRLRAAWTTDKVQEAVIKGRADAMELLMDCMRLSTRPLVIVGPEPLKLEAMESAPASETREAWTARMERAGWCRCDHCWARWETFQRKDPVGAARILAAERKDPARP